MCKTSCALCLKNLAFECSVPVFSITVRFSCPFFVSVCPCLRVRVCVSVSACPCHFGGLSNVLGVFQMFCGVFDKLLHYHLNMCCELLGVHLFLGGVLHVWATVLINNIMFLQLGR